MKKRFLAVIIVLAAALCLSTAAFAAGDGTELQKTFTFDFSEPQDISAPRTVTLLSYTDDADTDAAYEEMKAAVKKALLNGDDRTESIDVSGLGFPVNSEGINALRSIANAAFMNAIYDNPEASFAHGTMCSYVYGYDGSGVITVLHYNMTDGRISGCDGDAFRAAVDRACEACFAEGMTDLEKVIAAHDWIAVNCQYDPYVGGGCVPVTYDGVTYDDSEYVYSPYGVFVNGNAVCQGYSLALKVLLDRAGVECCYVSSNVMGHAWNMVKLDGKWYHIDTTWDDPIYAGGCGDLAGSVRHEYSLKSDSSPEFNNSGTGEHFGWTTEYGYTCGESYDLNDLPENGNAPVVVYGGKLYMAANGYLYALRFGSEFDKSNAEKLYIGASGSECGALDFGSGYFYLLARSGSTYTVRAVYLPTLTAEAESFNTLTGENYMMMYGIRISGGSLYFRSSYTDSSGKALLSAPVRSTDKTMPVYFSCPTDTCLNGLTTAEVSVTSDETYDAVDVFLAFYDAEGRMLGVGTVRAVNGKLDLSGVTLPTGTKCAVFFALAGSEYLPCAEQLDVA